MFEGSIDREAYRILRRHTCVCGFITVEEVIKLREDRCAAGVPQTTGAHGRER